MAEAQATKARGKRLTGIAADPAYWAKPGEVRNPTGKNQWTYRRDFEASVAKLMKVHGDAIAERLVTGAKRGKDLRLLITLIERVFPKVERHEHSGDLAVTADLAALEARLARLAGARGPKGGSGGSSAS